MRLKLILIVNILIIVCVSCSKNINTDKEIYRVVINSIVKPLPPPPPPSKNGDFELGISKKVLDSIDRVSIDIAVYSFLMDFKGDFKGDFNGLFLDFKSTKFDYSVSNSKLNVKDLAGRESLKFTVLEDSILNFNEILKVHDGVLFLSDIKYNQGKDKALAIVGYTVGSINRPKSNITYLYLLQKKNFVWEIVNRRRLMIS